MIERFSITNPSGKVMRDPHFSQQPVIAGIYHCVLAHLFSLLPFLLLSVLFPAPGHLL